MLNAKSRTSQRWQSSKSQVHKPLRGYYVSIKEEAPRELHGNQLKTCTMVTAKKKCMCILWDVHLNKGVKTLAESKWWLAWIWSILSNSTKTHIFENRSHEATLACEYRLADCCERGRKENEKRKEFADSNMQKARTKSAEVILTQSSLKQLFCNWDCAGSMWTVSISAFTLALHLLSLQYQSGFWGNALCQTASVSISSLLPINIQPVPGIEWITMMCISSHIIIANTQKPHCSLNVFKNAEHYSECH